MARQETAVGSLMRIRRPDTCADCNTELPAGTLAYWVRAEQAVRCLPCFDTSAFAARVEREHVQGVAGRSAQREYERRSARERRKFEERVAVDAEWRERIRKEHPLLGSTITALKSKPRESSESQSTTAWRRGAEGERRVAKVLDEVKNIEVLHDRRIPGSRANIDHIVVAPSGVFVIDAKYYKGAVEVRNVGGLFRVDERLYVNGRDRSKLVDGVLHQVEVVRSVLAGAHPEATVRGVLCFVDGDSGWTTKPRHIGSVIVLLPKVLARYVSSEGDQQVTQIASRLKQDLKPAS
jgi:hypothetical protein